MMLHLLLSQIVLFPAALLCFLPMQNKLRFSRFKTTWIVSLSLIAAILFCSWLGYRFSLIGNTNEDILLMLLFPLFFVAYILCVKHRCANLWRFFRRSFLCFRSLPESLPACTMY